MRNPPTAPTNVCPEPSVEDTRAYAFHLYQQSNHLPGHDLDNWLEASACLKASIPAHQSHARLHHHCRGSESDFTRAERAARGGR